MAKLRVEVLRWFIEFPNIQRDLLDPELFGVLHNGRDQFSRDTSKS